MRSKVLVFIAFKGKGVCIGHLVGGEQVNMERERENKLTYVHK